MVLKPAASKSIKTSATDEDILKIIYTAMDSN
jgi:hypothetical protein